MTHSLHSSRIVLTSYDPQFHGREFSQVFSEYRHGYFMFVRLPVFAVRGTHSWVCLYVFVKYPAMELGVHVMLPDSVIKSDYSNGTCYTIWLLWNSNNPPTMCTLDNSRTVVHSKV